MDPSRYERQIAFSGIGPSGQERIGRGSVLVVGCGALGASIAEFLVRMGVGRLVLVDRDLVSVSNLPRQALFDERDVADNLPKVEAARRKLTAINSGVTIETHVSHLTFRNVADLATGADIILDGADNFETRMLVNDYAVHAGTPWVYGAVLGATGLSMNVLPGSTPCLRCVFEEPPAPGAPTTETDGVIAPIVRIIAAVEVTEAVKFLMGKSADMSRSLLSVDAWRGEFRSMDISDSGRDQPCPACKQRKLEWLSGLRGAEQAVRVAASTVHLDGRGPLDIDALAHRIGKRAGAMSNAFLVKIKTDRYTIVVFADGRAIIEGTGDVSEARELYERLIDEGSL